MNAELNNVIKLRRLPWALAHLSLSSVFARITYAGPVFLLFLSALGFSKFSIGLILALFASGSLLAFIVASLVQRIGYKKSFVVFESTRVLLFGSLLLTPWLYAQIGSTAVIIFCIVVIVLFVLLRSASDTAFSTWFQDFVPSAARNRFSTASSIIVAISGIIALCFAAYFIGAKLQASQAMTLFLVGVIFGIGSVLVSLYIPGSDSVHKHQVKLNLSLVLDALQNRDYALYLAGIGLVTLANAPLLFLPLFIQEHVRLADSLIVLLSAVTLAASLASSFGWEWAVHRWGSRPVIILSLCAITLMPIAWLLIPDTSFVNISIALLISVLAGITSSGWNIGAMRMLLNGVVSSEKTANYLTIHYAWTGLIGGIGPLLAGAVLDVLHSPIRLFPGLSVDAYTILFVLSFLLSMASILFFRQVSEYRSIRVRDLLGMLFHGNAFGAAGSFIQYKRARAESERVAVTERMGAGKNPFNFDELMDTLADPSFNVRYEVIVSIARMPPNDRIINSLIDVLHGNEPELILGAIWALGRLGDKQAIAPLRETLDSNYALVQAQSARALATLGDYDIVPVLLEKFRSESDDRLRLAYATALGALKSKDILPEILNYLRSMRGKDTRMELTLAVARIGSAGEDFVLLARYARANLAQAMEQMIQNLKRLSMPDDIKIAFHRRCDDCAERFARGNFDSGAEALAVLLRKVPQNMLNEFSSMILRECIACIDLYGSQRIEYLLLSVAVFQAALRE